MPVLQSDNEYFRQSLDRLVLEGGQVAFSIFEECTFSNCNFQETKFRGCRFLKGTFKNCNLNLMQVNDSTFTNTTFKYSSIVGVNWIEANWPKKGVLGSIAFENCAVNHATFIGLNLVKLKLVRCQARDVDFSEVNLTGADLRDSDFEKSRFVQTNLTKADLRGAKNYFIPPQLNILKKTRFSLPEAMSLLYSLDIVLEESSPTG